MGSDYTARRFLALVQEAGGYPAPLADLDPAPPEGPAQPALHSVVKVSDLLAPEFVERLWSHFPLNAPCNCEEPWDPELGCYVHNDDCQCDRKLILTVRNCLAAALGEPQVSHDD